MIGTLQLHRVDSPRRRESSLQHLISMAVLVLIAASGIEAWGQATPAEPQEVQANKIPGKTEEKEKKPNLAERNNITAKPLMTLDKEKANLKLRQIDYPAALRAQNPTRADEETIRAGVQDRVYRLTMPENWANIANLRRDLVQDIDSDRFSGDSRPRTRAIALDAAVKELRQLLTDQPEFVKLNVVLLLGDLNEKSADFRNNVPPTPYVPAAEPLLELVQASDQPTVVKVLAVRGLARILRDGHPPRTMRDQIAEVLSSELRATFGKQLADGDTWYQWRLVDALGMVGEPRTAIQQPLAVDVLWETMLNENLRFHVRAHAARALSQIDLDGQFNVALLAHEIVRLCGIMTAEYNGQPGLDYWRECFMDLYFAFNPQLEEEKRRGWGLNQQITESGLRVHSSVVNGAYGHVLKMVNGVMEHSPPQPVEGATLQSAAEWLRNNAPPDQKLHPQAKTVEAIQKEHVPQDKENTAVSENSAAGDGA